MKVIKKGNNTIIKDTTNDLLALVTNLTQQYKTFESQNLIIDISNYKNISSKEVNTFLPLSKLHRKAKKSFVIVIEDFDFNKASSLTIVPSVLEAHDIIEMEEIERDLGF